MTSKQRAYLRGIANKVEPIFQYTLMLSSEY